MANDNKQPKRNRVKETFLELKKVTWPSFGKVVKQTATVLVVTLFFMLILLAMDQLLGLAYSKFTDALGSGETATAAVQAMSGYGGAFSTNALPLLF